MSFTELKRLVVELPRADRLQLAALLAQLDERDDPQFRRKIDRRMKAMDAGDKVTMEEFEARHLALKKQGR